MEFEIVEITELSGSKAKIYTVLPLDTDSTLFDNFIETYRQLYPAEIRSIAERLMLMGNEYGAQEYFFKHNEGRPGDGVSALFDLPGKHLRLYCIRYGSCTIILGSGGPKTTRTYNEDPVLNTAATTLSYVSEIITSAIKEKEVKIDSDGNLVGKLIFKPEEYE